MILVFFLLFYISYPLAEPQGTALKTIYLPKTFKFTVPTDDF